MTAPTPLTETRVHKILCVLSSLLRMQLGWLLMVPTVVGIPAATLALHVAAREMEEGADDIGARRVLQLTRELFGVGLRLGAVALAVVGMPVFAAVALIGSLPVIAGGCGVLAICGFVLLSQTGVLVADGITSLVPLMGGAVARCMLTPRRALFTAGVWPGAVFAVAVTPHAVALVPLAFVCSGPAALAARVDRPPAATASRCSRLVARTGR